MGEAEAAGARDRVGQRAGQHVAVGGGRGARAGVLRAVARVVARVHADHVLGHRLRELLDQRALEAERDAVELLALLARLADVGGDRDVGAGHRGNAGDVAHDFTWLAICRSWSCIWTALLASWKLRCASIISLIESATSTFDASTAPCVRRPPASAVAAPLAAVVRKRLSPADCSPCGERTVMSWIRPTWRLPTEIVPSEAIRTSDSFVPAGRVTAGWSRSPCCVVMRPRGSRRRAPSRVSAVVPSARRTWMKPPFSIARSSGLPVSRIAPCANPRPIVVAAAPAPLCTLPEASRT